MVHTIIENTQSYINSRPKSERKKIGQFFTPKETAVFMAKMFIIPQKRVLNILDAGAGSGILSAAIIEEIQQYNHVEEIHLVCYENNLDILDLLRENLQYIQQNSTIPVHYSINANNYILSQIEYDLTTSIYDLIISNPPYLKLSKDAQEALALPFVCHGAPNIYFLFMTMSVINLENGGEMVFIIPRSWTSGAYFRQFREYILNESKITNIHLFISRSKVFENDDVLQETMIIKFVKTRNTIDQVLVSSSVSNNDFSSQTRFEVPYSVVVSNDKYIYLVTSKYELDTIQKVQQFTYNLPKLGLKMKTGITVDFRNKQHLRSNKGENIPLFYSQHIQNGIIEFPIGKENEYITTDNRGLIQKNKNYLFIKRFSTKEEPRRLQSGVYLASKFSDYSFISTQNKINFIDSENNDELSVELVYGLYAIFNSSIYDSYYRILNGSTQVNSTEINSMPMPSKDNLILIGNKLIARKEFSTFTCDEFLNTLL